MGRGSYEHAPRFIIGSSRRRRADLVDLHAAPAPGHGRTLPPQLLEVLVGDRQLHVVRALLGSLEVVDDDVQLLHRVTRVGHLAEHASTVVSQPYHPLL